MLKNLVGDHHVEEAVIKVEASIAERPEVLWPFRGRGIEIGSEKQVACPSCTDDNLASPAAVVQDTWALNA